jgi:C-terminal processing protease CtpA/Prc
VNWDRNVWLQYVGRSPYTQVKPNLGTSEFDGVPYLVVGGWTSQFTVDDLDAALERFRGRSALIVDVRANGGGNDQLALALAARFTTTSVTGEYLQFRNGPRHSDLTAEQPRTISPRGSWQFAGRVMVLVGRRCASSNESFIAFMREMPNVTVVGDTTAGATGNPAPVALSDGWKVWVPRWIARTAEHRIIEWNGIAPDVFVAATPADFSAGRDPVLDYAVAALRGGG